MKDLLLEMKAEVERAKALDQHELDLLLLARFLCRDDELLAEGYQANPPPPFRGRFFMLPLWERQKKRLGCPGSPSCPCLSSFSCACWVEPACVEARCWATALE